MKQVEASAWLDRLITWSLEHPLPVVTRYAVATITLLLVAMIRSAFITDLVPWLLFIPVALLAALLMGKTVGLYSAGLAAILAGVSIARPNTPFLLTSAQWTGTVLFMLVAVGVVLLAAELRAAFRRARLLVRQLATANEHLHRQEEERELLKGELEHRLKNLLSIVQAVAGQTLRKASDLKSAEEDLSFRLAALARASEILTGSNWAGADLHDIAEAAVAAHRGQRHRISLSGPPVRFTARVALALALTFHELATNATKYGALSDDGGRVEVQWSLDPGAEPDECRFRLRWQEIGGPPVSPPRRRGFGSRVIERSMRAYFHGEAEIAYPKEGVVFSLDGKVDSHMIETASAA